MRMGLSDWGLGTGDWGLGIGNEGMRQCSECSLKFVTLAYARAHLGSVYVEASDGPSPKQG
jgi:hypothetical protein